MFIIAIVGAAVGVVIWVYKLTHPLDVRLTALTTRIDTLERNYNERDREFRNTETEKLVTRLVARLTKDIRDKTRREANNQ